MTNDILAPPDAMGVFSDCLNEWEALPTELLKRLLRSDDVVVEAGAGTGKTTLAAARIARKVFAFDPHPQVGQWFQDAALPFNLSFFQCALGLRNGEQTFHLNNEFWNSSATQEGTLYGEFVKSIKVPAIDISAFVALVGATFVVLDVEGAEQELLNAIESCPTVRGALVELHPYKGVKPFQTQSLLLQELIPDGNVVQAIYTRAEYGK